MNYLSRKLKSLSVGLMALSFLFAVSLSACSTKSGESEDTTEATEEHMDHEHPAVEEEQPSSDEEAAADSTATEEHEHPAGEHPSGD